MIELVVKYLNRQTSTEESQQVEKWRNDHPEEFLEIKTVWALTGTYDAKSEQVSMITQIPKKKRVYNWSIAAAIAMLMMVGAIWFINRPKDISVYQIATQVKLKDGSKVTLYKDASIEYLTADQRQIKLTGKAFFEVKPQKENPFKVFTEQAIVTVKGTSFQVDAIKEGTTEVTVETGLVNFAANPQTTKIKSPAIDLKKGEKGIISPMAKGIIKQNNRNENHVAWATQVISFKQERLHRASDLIEEVYGYKLVFSNKRIANCTITATYVRKSPKQLAKIIADTFGFTYTITDKNEIIFDGEVCN